MAPTPPRLQGFDYSASRSYFVTFCVSRREPIFRNQEAASIAQSIILGLRRRLWFWLYAYCIMPDHLHLVFKKNQGSRSVQTIVSSLKRQILMRCRANGVGFRWQPGFYDRIVREYEMSDEFVKYVLLNPVRAGLAADFTAYKYCGVVDRWR